VTTTTPTKPKRRLLRFSLRALLLLMILVCVTLGWKIVQVRKQRAVVAWVQESGGNVLYDYESYVDGWPQDNPRPPGPEFLRKLLGDDFFSNVTYIEISEEELSDVTPLAGLASLIWLGLDNTRVSDVMPLAGLTSLSFLYLENTQISDVTPLARLTSLEELDLRYTQVSDVTPLAGLTLLQELNLDNTQISEDDYKMLQEALPNCIISWSRAAESP